MPIERLAPMLADGRIGAAAVFDACVEALRADDAAALPVNAVRCIDPAARAWAQRLDDARRAGGPLHGVPIVVKDNIDVAGLATTSGSLALARAMPRGDACVVARLRVAGAVILGKANMAELSFDVRSRSSLTGDVRNPFDRTVTSGGSSGGTAAAVAAGFAVAGLGTDTGGSVRNPAGFTGLVGLRPTHGRISLAGVAPLSPTTDTVGPIARSVADAALLFAVLAGTPFRAVRGEVAGRRIGVLRQFAGIDSAVDAALEHALGALAGQGVVVVDPLLLPQSVVPRPGRPHIVDAEFVVAFDAYLAANFAAGDVPPSVRAILEEGKHLPELARALSARLDPAASGEAAWRAIRADRHALTETLSQLMAANGLDALVYPTAAAAPRSLDKPASGWAPELAAMTGWPALSVPAGRTSSGIPLGIDLLARADEEPLLFALGAAVERRLGPRAVPR